MSLAQNRRSSLGLLTLLSANLATGFIAAWPAQRSVAPERRLAVASPRMVDPSVNLVADVAAVTVEPLANLVCEAGAACGSALADMEVDGGLLSRMARTAAYVGLGIAGAYVTQGAEGVEVDPEEDGGRRQPFDRTLPPPRGKSDDYDDEWPWDDRA